MKRRGRRDRGAVSTDCLAVGDGQRSRSSLHGHSRRPALEPRLTARDESGGAGRRARDRSRGAWVSFVAVVPLTTVVMLGPHPFCLSFSLAI